MPVRYCAQCGAELSTRVESGRERPACPRCGFIVYRNPVPVAVVQIVHEGKILLLLRRHAPLANYWAPPAGYIEIDESLEDGAAREVKEETNLSIAVDRVVTVHSAPNAGVILVLFDALWTGGELLVAEDEVIQAKWFSPEELPSQPPPENTTPMERLFYRSLESLFAEFKSRIAAS